MRLCVALSIISLAFPSPGSQSLRHTDEGLPALTSSARPLASNADFAGALIRTPGGNAQVLDLVWGLTTDDRLIAAYSRLLYSNGELATSDNRAAAKRLFHSPRDMHGFFMPLGSAHSAASDVWIEDIVFSKDLDGTIIIASYTGLSNGVPVSDSNIGASLYDKCKWHATIVCASAPGNPCLAGCPTVGQCTCSGQGNCNNYGSGVCDGPCDAPQDCNTGPDPKNPGACICRDPE
jgi:hypothetical protein